MVEDITSRDLALLRAFFASIKEMLEWMTMQMYHLKNVNDLVVKLFNKQRIVW